MKESFRPCDGDRIYTFKQEAPLTLREQRSGCRNIKGVPQIFGSFPSPRPLFLWVWCYGGPWQTPAACQIGSGSFKVFTPWDNVITDLREIWLGPKWKRPDLTPNPQVDLSRLLKSTHSVESAKIGGPVYGSNSTFLHIYFWLRSDPICRANMQTTRVMTGACKTHNRASELQNVEQWSQINKLKLGRNRAKTQEIIITGCNGKTAASLLPGSSVYPVSKVFGVTVWLKTC